ncbi:MAG TPA: amidohydrolase family protein, partial [Blastocatellia bacterium]|nr:amidohydrolase family protein [Blastocatellia bacterium]
MSLTRMLFILLSLACALIVAFTMDGNITSAQSNSVLIKARHFIDVRAGRVLDNQGILVQGERVKEVGPVEQVEGRAGGARVIDLGEAFVLPGLIDCHTHVLLQGDITSQEYDEQLLKESIPFRTIRATVAARTALMNGFTTMRDVETEGAMYADVDVKRAINLGY